MTQDFKLQLMHLLTRSYRLRGFSFTCAAALAMRDVEARSGDAYDIREHFQLTANDERLLAAMDEKRGAA